MTFAQQLTSERDVLAGVRRTILDEDALARHAHSYRNLGELIRLRFLPEMLRDRSQPAREDEQRRPAVEKQAGTALRYTPVVAA
jgi:hypothetical protein